MSLTISSIAPGPLAIVNKLDSRHKQASIKRFTRPKVNLTALKEAPGCMFGGLPGNRRFVVHGHSEAIVFVGDEAAMNRFAKNFSGHVSNVIPLTEAFPGTPRPTSAPASNGSLPGPTIPTTTKAAPEWLDGFSKYLRDQVTPDLQAAIELAESGKMQVADNVERLTTRTAAIEQQLAHVESSITQSCDREKVLADRLQYINKRQQSENAKIEACVSEHARQLSLLLVDVGTLDHRLQMSEQRQRQRHEAQAAEFGSALDKVRATSAKKTELAELSSDVDRRGHELNAQLDATRGDLRNVRSQIKNVEQKFVAKDELKSLKHHLALERIADVERVEAAAALQGETVAALASTVEDHDTRMRGLLQAVAQLQQQLVALERGVDQERQRHNQPSLIQRRWTTAKTFVGRLYRKRTEAKTSPTTHAIH